MAIQGARITFAKNPWPKGHGIEKATWTGELLPDELRFHLHVESADYDAEDDRGDDDELDDAWKARIVWTNYHSCILSSTNWGHHGFVAGTPDKPCDLERLEGKTFRVDDVEGDKLDEDIDLGSDPAFGIYLLGHDAVAAHRIEFVKRRGPRTYDLEWRARIALAYTGNYELEHKLVAIIPKLRLDRIELGGGLTMKTAKPLLPRVLVGADRFAAKRGAFVAT
jgi:hypothetical protein